MLGTNVVVKSCTRDYCRSVGVLAAGFFLQHCFFKYRYERFCELRKFVHAGLFFSERGLTERAKYIQVCSSMREFSIFSTKVVCATVRAEYYL